MYVCMYVTFIWIAIVCVCVCMEKSKRGGDSLSGVEDRLQKDIFSCELRVESRGEMECTGLACEGRDGKNALLESSDVLTLCSHRARTHHHHRMRGRTGRVRGSNRRGIRALQSLRCRKEDVRHLHADAIVNFLNLACAG